MIKLPFPDAPFGNVLKLPLTVPRSGLFRNKLKVGLDDVAHIPQQQGGPLLDVVGRTQVQLPLPRSITVRAVRADTVDFTSLRRRLLNRMGAQT